MTSESQGVLIGPGEAPATGRDGVGRDKPRAANTKGRGATRTLLFLIVLIFGVAGVTACGPLPGARTMHKKKRDVRKAKAPGDPDQPADPSTPPDAPPPERSR